MSRRNAIALATLLPVLLTSCGKEYPEDITGTKTVLVRLTRRPDAGAECARRTGIEQSIACATYTKDGTFCEIVMQPDASNEDLGHEARHCFDGNWHRPQYQGPA